MKKRFSGLLTLAIVFIVVFTSCGKKQEEQILRVGATPVPHVDLLEFVRPKLLEKGIKLEIVEFADYVTPNTSLVEKSTDANLYQHKPFMENFNAQNKANLVALGRVNLNPMGLYSNKIKDLKDVNQLKKGAVLALPNDPVNEARALLFLEVNGLIKLKEGLGIKAGIKDVAENPYGFTFKPVEAAQVPRVLPDVDLAVITGNYALGAGLNPSEQALALEDTRSEFPNVLVTRDELKNDPRVKALLEALQSKEMVEFMNQKYKGSVVPGFEVK